MNGGDYIVLRMTDEGGNALPRPSMLNPSTAAPAAGPAIADLEVHSALSDADVTELANDPTVAEVAPDFPLMMHEPFDGEAEEAAAEAQQEAGRTWGLEAVGVGDSPAFTGQNVTVAVLDTGIKRDHAAFAHIDEANLVTKNFTSEDDTDLNGHGTHCAGTIFGQPVDGLAIGVAPGIKRALIGKVLGSGGGSTATLVRAIQWAKDEGADIISMSLGIDFTRFVADLSAALGDGLSDKARIRAATSQALEAYLSTVRIFETLLDQISALEGDDAPLIVAATGNDSRRDLARPSVVGVSPPAASPSILGVGAVGEDSSGQLAMARFSNSGPALVGPGVNVTSAWNDGELNTISGTSMATPHVAGLAALWIERQVAERGSASVMDLAIDLNSSASTDPLIAKRRLDVGRGLPMAPAAL